MKNPIRMVIFAAATVVLGVASAAHATVIASESFNYATGPLTGDNGGTGWDAVGWAQNGTTNTVNVVATGIAAPAGTDANPSTTSAQWIGGPTNSANYKRTFSSPITTSVTGSGNTLYLSFLVKRADTTDANIAFVLHLSNGDGVDIGIDPSDTVGGGGANWSLFDNSSALTFNDTGVATSTNATFMVASLNLSTGVANLYVNPQGANQPITPSATLTFVTPPLTATFISMFASATGTTTNYANIAFGSTYADVVPAPEPCTLALLALPAARLLIRRRRSAGALI